MVEYPISFSADLQSGSSMSEPWSMCASGHRMSCSIPEEFQGSGGALSPEDLFLLALSNCFVATFKVYASASHLNYSFINIQSKLVIDKAADGTAVAKSCHISVYVGGAEQPSRIATILKKVVRSGILLNSVKTEIDFEFEVNGERLELGLSS